MADHGRHERRALVDALRRVGPDAPTLCEGWTASDLAAHLVLRERRPDAAAGIVIPSLAGRTARIQERLREGRPWTSLVAAIAAGPPLPVRVFGIDDLMNGAEYFIHTEDIRRAEKGWEPRDLPDGLEKVLWARARFLGRMARKSIEVGLEFVAPGFGRSQVASGSPAVTMTGTPSEILLFVAGRKDVARVNLDGPPEAVELVRSVRFGL